DDDSQVTHDGLGEIRELGRLDRDAAQAADPADLRDAVAAQVGALQIATFKGNLAQPAADHGRVVELAVADHGVDEDAAGKACRPDRADFVERGRVEAAVLE